MSRLFNAEGAEEDLNSSGDADWSREEISLSERDRKKARKAWRARLRRREKIQRVVDAAAERWRRRTALPIAPPAIDPEAVLRRTLPRPQGLGVPAKEHGKHSGYPSPPRELAFKAGVVRSALRLLVWLGGGCLFGLGVLWDWVRQRNTQENRARRLREMFEAMGTTFVKVGQQLSLRLDLLAYAYTHELEKLLDNLPPFPTDDAIRMIERATGRPLGQLFSAFDPEPIGSASVSCVYQGVLRSGERVAVKVRRPGIGSRLAADLRALGWLLYVAELIFLAPGFTTNFIYELRTMLMEELDFAREARFAELYRRRTRKTSQLGFVSVPRVFFDYSTDDVIVAEFVSGIWLTEILRALDTRDLEALGKLENMNIDCVILARRIQLIARFNNFENIFFHADLHPANILIQPGNKIVLIDFGSCGSFNNKELNSWRRWFDAQSIDDVGGMVQAALGIIEPLPPVDKEAFGQRLETAFWNNLYAIKSKHSDWSERMPSRLWLDFLELSRKFQIPMRLNTLRMIRASVLSDTISLRLDNDQDSYREFRYYEKGAGRRAEKRVHKRVARVLGPSKFIRIEQGLDSAFKLIYQVQRAVDSLNSIQIGVIIAKVDYFLSMVLRLLAWGFSTATLMTSGRWVFGLFGWSGHTRTSILAALFVVLRSRLWQAIAITPTILVLWRLSFRLKEPRPWD